MESIWPVAAGGSGTTDGWRLAMAARLERMLHDHVIAPWFPRVVDEERGGYTTDLDRAWRPMGPDERMLEYQARQMRSAARLGRAFPRDARWPEIVRHGMRYINDFMRDERDGGWYWLIDKGGKPLAEGTKTAHSTAYVITGMAEAYLLTGDETALAAAQDAFDWLEATLHDADHGGYHGWATRDGRPIMDRSQVASWQRATDPLGHDIGLKDANVHSDLLESLRVLYRARPTAAVALRLREMQRIVAERFIEPDGQIHYLLQPDLSAVATSDHPGYGLQCAYRLPLAAGALGDDPSSALALGQRVVDWAWATGWTNAGGLREKVGPDETRKRTWWVQTEAMTALTLLDVCGITSTRDRIEELMRLLENQFLDDRHGGWFEIPRADWSAVQRLLGRRLAKAHRWKDASHETDMALSCIRMLRAVSADAALES